MNSSLTEALPSSQFTSTEAETKYWIDVARMMHRTKKEIEKELQEYQESSLILEKELESSLEQSDKKNKELMQQNFRLSKDNEYLKHKLTDQIAEYSSLQIQMNRLKIQNEELIKSVRKLEQTTDDLERDNRQMTVAKETLEMQFNTTLEKLVLLETEVEEKEGFKIIVQRLKDENKDLKDQIQVDHRLAEGSYETKRLNTACGLCRFNSVRYKTCRHSAGSRKSPSVERDFYEDCNQSETDYLIKCIQDLAKKVDCLEQSQMASTMIQQDVNESQLSQATSSILLMKLENGDTLDDSEDRVRSPRSKLADKSHPYSFINKQEDRRNSIISNRNRIENRVKKVKEEEKLQLNLSGFFRKLRHSPKWMPRRKSKG